MTVSEYLANLRKQAINDDTILKHLQLLDCNELSGLEGSTTEHQQAQAVHDLLRECEGEKSDLLCRYLLQEKILQPKHDLYARSTYLKRYKQLPGLTSTNRLPHSHLYFAQHNLFALSLIQDGWNRLGSREKAVLVGVSISVGAGVAMQAIFLKAGGIPEAGPGVLGRGVRMGAAQKARMLDDIRQGVRTNARAMAGNPGVKIVNKAPPAIREQLKRKVKAGVKKI